MEKSNKRKIKKNKIFIDWVIPIVSALIIAFLVKTYIFFNIYVPTGSMIPTINKDDKLLVSKIFDLNNLKRGDTIVFYSQEFSETLIKRLIGLPGDKVEIKNGLVSVNGELLQEDYVKNKDKYNGTFDVPNGKYFFLGDNRPVSKDARLWVNPYIDSSDIKGKAQFIFYPFVDFGILKNN